MAVPVNNDPAIPAPPDTINAPVTVDMDAVEAVTANPETETILLDGFTTNVEIVDNPKPVPEAALTVVIENCEFTTVGATATEEAAEAGTFCQVGAEPVPLDVRTCPTVEEVAYLDQVDAELATIISPIALGPCKPVPP